MTVLRLVIEHSTAPQPERERLLEEGELSIGRGADCDWRIDDPEMFVSRKHCIVSAQQGRFLVTDASRGGLFIDGADAALGAGNSTALEDGMRLRLGDVVIRAEIAVARPVPGPATAPRGSDFDADDFFTPRPQPQPAPRPETLPEPFDTGRPSMAVPVDRDRPAPPVFDDPFTLDPVATPAQVGSAAGERRPTTGDPVADLSSDDFFSGWARTPADAGRAPDPRREPPETGDAGPPRARERGQSPVPQPEPEPFPAFADPSPGIAAPMAGASPQATAETAPSGVAGSDADALVLAFCRGLGIAPAFMAAAGPSEAEIEAIGRRFRLLAEGLVQLLRIRSQEKQSVRVAQTVIGSSDVNPLKFLATTDEIVAALIAPRGKGYLAPDEAITGALRDLTDHQMRAWTGLQTALRAMIDRFDPARFEEEIEAAGLFRSLLSGSRSARLWQLYSERYREIARSAEDRFLGEVGADFRDSYEGARRNGHAD